MAAGLYPAGWIGSGGTTGDGRAARDVEPPDRGGECALALPHARNNAGIYEFTPLEAVSEEEFHRLFNTNVLGVLLATREAVKHFGPNGGSVINLGSVVTRTAPPTSAVYVATKSAVEGITRVLAKELGPRRSG